MDHESHGEPHGHPITPPSVYLKVYGILVIFMIATVAAAQVQMGALNNLVAMLIGITKAVLVVLFFMQVKYASRLTWLWASIGFLWLLVLFITLQDYVSRGWVSVAGW